LDFAVDVIVHVIFSQSNGSKNFSQEGGLGSSFTILVVLHDGRESRGLVLISSQRLAAESHLVLLDRRLNLNFLFDYFLNRGGRLSRDKRRTS
jgi:hypothetical protein